MDGEYTARLRFRTAANEDGTCCAEWTGAEPKLIIYKDGTRREVVVSMQEGSFTAEQISELVQQPYFVLRWAKFLRGLPRTA